MRIVISRLSILIPYELVAIKMKNFSFLSLDFLKLLQLIFYQTLA